MSILTDKKVMMGGPGDWVLIRRVILSLYGDMGVIHVGDPTEKWEMLFALDKALGVNMLRSFKERPTSQDEPMSEEWRHFLTSLAGPHGKTLLKVYQARRGIIK